MSKPQQIVVTACNDLYLPLALGLLKSLREVSFSTPFDIGVIDVGLGDETKARIAAFGAIIVPAQLHFDYPGRAAWEEHNFAYRAMTSRPFLREHFTGYQTYLWIDADAWAQTPDAIDTMLAGAANSDALHIISEIDRDYTPYFLSSQPWNYHFKWYSANFPRESVAAIFPRPMLNSGVLTMHTSSPVWKAWGDTLAYCLQNKPVITRDQFMCDQLSLNMAVYTQGLPLKVMPAEYNWLSLYATPMWDAERKLFVRPTPPRSVISILHLTHEKKLREFDLDIVGGGTYTRTLLNQTT